MLLNDSRAGNPFHLETHLLCENEQLTWALRWTITADVSDLSHIALYYIWRQWAIHLQMAALILQALHRNDFIHCPTKLLRFVASLRSGLNEWAGHSSVNPGFTNPDHQSAVLSQGLDSLSKYKRHCSMETSSSWANQRSNQVGDGRRTLPRSSLGKLEVSILW